jgi:hypothetical protein
MCLISDNLSMTNRSRNALNATERCKIISRINISCPKTNAELRDLGFTKLVKRDDGVYENVTARGSDSRYMVKGKSETIPDLSKTISD